MVRLTNEALGSSVSVADDAEAQIANLVTMGWKVQGEQATKKPAAKPSATKSK